MQEAASIPRPGPVLLFGSGETAPGSRRIYDTLFASLSAPLRAAVFETPAGFEPNSALVAQQVADFWARHMERYKPQTTVIPARKKGGRDSPDNEALLAPIYHANVIYSGAGSPTYAVRQYRDSLAWQRICLAQRAGAALVLASASVLAASRFTVPVYEIFKAGEDLHWRDGLDFFGDYGLELALVPHWNNRDGGVALDTSRCYLGQSRFDRLRDMLPSPSATTVGIDEHTALWMDLAAATCRVVGRGRVTVLRDGVSLTLDSGAEFPMRELGPFHAATLGHFPSAMLGEFGRGIEHSGTVQPGPEVLELMEQRQEAREAGEWGRADAFRADLLARGWLVEDTPGGTILRPRRAHPTNN